MDFDQGLFIGDPDSGQEDAGFSTDGFGDGPVIDVEIEELAGAAGGTAAAGLPRLAEKFNTETRFQGLSLSQLAVHSLWIVDYLRQLGETEMADGDLDSIAHCADDLEGAIMLMFQLAGGTRQELRQRYQEIKMAVGARHQMQGDFSRKQ